MRGHSVSKPVSLSAVLSALTLICVAAAQAVQLTDEQRAAIEARIRPVGDVCLRGAACGGIPMPALAAVGAAAAPAVDGEATYNTACLACHATGAGGAPIVGDVAAWADRIAKGADALHNSGLNGVAGTTMMAKGGRADLSDAAVIAAVDFMISSSR